MSAMLLYIITNAILFSFVLTNEQIPQHLADWLVGMGLGWVGFLLVVNILLLLAGNVMEPSSIILIMAPILFPVAVKLGIDPVHFGLVMVLNLMIGLLHPPMGLVLFVLARVAKLSVERTTMAILPWLVPLLISLAIVTYIPSISLWLPNAVR